MQSKIILILFLNFCVQIFAFGQSINYEEIGFSDVLNKAKKSKQLIFVQMTANNCGQCNTVADRGLSGDEIDDIFSNFISIQVQPGTNDYVSISKKYRISPNYPTSLFINHEGHFLGMMYNRSTSQTSEYIKLAALALANQNKPPIASYTKKYLSGNYDSDFMEEYIVELSKYQLNTDDLVDDYVGKLTIDSLFTTNKLTFLIKSAPLIESKTYKLIHFDEEQFMSIFMSFPLSERIEINNKIINKSRKKAYEEKDASYMNKVARFVQGTYTDDYRRGRKAQELNLLGFYKEMKDTSNYIRSAGQYYQFHIQNLDMDSICKVEKESFIDTQDGRRIMGGRLLKVGNQINEMAWTIYEFTDDPEQLGMVLKWAERILGYENPAYHDTYAHILYKIGAREKAIEWQQKAIDLSDSLRRPSVELTEELNKMKNGEKL